MIPCCRRYSSARSSSVVYCCNSIRFIQFDHLSLSWWSLLSNHLEQLFARAINISFDVGCRYLIVQSKQTAKTFYEKKFGFSHAKDLDNGHVLYYKNMITLTKDYIK